MMATMSHVSHWHEKYMVDVPEGESGPVRIERFTVAADSIERARIAFSGRLAPPPGEYTKLTRRGALWMSDTPAEIKDHREAMLRMHKAERALVNGLGLGLVVRHALSCEHMRQVDVVEIDPDVIALVGPHYQAMAAERGVSLTIHEADAYTIQWPKGATWDVAWHDVWQSICGDNVDDMIRLHRRYGRRVGWQGSWCRYLCERGR